MYDHAQSPRLGQRTAVENPGVQLVSSLSLPAIAYRGQIVYALDIDQFRIYDGVAWQVPASGGSGTGNGSQTFVGPTRPVADNIGDTWLNTTDYQYYVWDGLDWQHTSSQQDQIYARTSIALVRALQRYTGTVLAHTAIFYDTVPPTTGFVQYDLWCNTSSNQVFQRIGQEWVRITDASIEADINAAGNDRFTLDGMIEVYFDSVSPLGLSLNDIGDIWVDTSAGNLIRGWTGAQWIDLQVTTEVIGDGAVTGVQIAEDAVDSEHLVDGSVITRHIDEGAVTSFSIRDFAVAARKFNSLSHQIY